MADLKAVTGALAAIDGFELTEVAPLGDLLLRAARRWPDRECIIFPERRITYGALAHSAFSRARSLMALGIGRGDHVAIFLPSCLEFAEILFAISLVGGIPVPINARYRDGELRYLLENSDAVAVITAGRITDEVNLFERLCEGIGDVGASDPFALALAGTPRLRHVVLLRDDAPGAIGPAVFESLAGEVQPNALIERRAQVRVRDTALILYTSGTTSNPKGCMLSHEAVVRNGRELANRYALTDADRFWSPLPMYHIGAIMPIAAILHVGCAYLTMARFEAGAALRMFADERVTINFLSFATFLVELLHHPDFERTDLSAMRLMNSNLPVQPVGLRDTLARMMPQTLQVSTYGLSETAGTVTTSRLDDPYDARMNRLGAPLPGVQVRIIDANGGNMARGTWGEIAVRGYNIIDGYYKDAEKTAHALRGGWLHTGDIGSLDEAGHLMFHGRTKEMLKVGGENVAALEVEAFIGGHPAVKLCQVVGIADVRLVEVPAAFIELKPNAVATESEVIAFCRGRISSFKIPRHVRFVTEWPIGASKIQKFKLVESLMAELQQSGEV